MNELEQLSTSIVVEWAYGVLTSDYAYFLLEPQAIQALVDKIAKSPIWSRRVLQNYSDRLTAKQILQMANAAENE